MRWRMYKTFIYASIAVLSVFMAYNAFASTQLPVEPNTSTTALGEANASTIDFKKHDVSEDVTIELIGISSVEHTILANGDGELNAVEVSNVSDLHNVNTILTKPNWKYVAKILESDPNALALGTYKIELLEDNEYKGSLFFKKNIVDIHTSNGIISTWDIGNDLPVNAIFNIKVTQCPC